MAGGYILSTDETITVYSGSLIYSGLEIVGFVVVFHEMWVDYVLCIICVLILVSDILIVP